LHDKIDDLLNTPAPPYFNLDNNNNIVPSLSGDFFQEPPWTSLGILASHEGEKDQFLWPNNNTALKTSRKISSDSGIIGCFGGAIATPTHPASFLNLIKMTTSINNNAGVAGRGSRCASFDLNECFYKQQLMHQIEDFGSKESGDK
jgi:hypothetical protein